MEIRVLNHGLNESNTWLVGDGVSCAVIDCGAPPADVLATAEAMGCRITHLVLTHGHVDHTCSLAALKEKTGALVCAHAMEQALLADPNASGYTMFGYPRPEPFPETDLALSEERPLQVGILRFEVIHTPGHTAGCICLRVGTHLFTGDTLFHRGVGRSDLPTGDEAALVRSIRNKLYTLPAALVVHPGHGPDTTIGEERMHNPYVAIR